MGPRGVINVGGKIVVGVTQEAGGAGVGTSSRLIPARWPRPR